MSYYLVERIKAQPNIEVLTQSEATALEGCDGNLETVRWRHCTRNQETSRPVSHLFLFIGADPNTQWLAQCDVALDENGFVRIGEGAPMVSAIHSYLAQSGSAAASTVAITRL
jgi:thioredoxin reductase (NADPH)